MSEIIASIIDHYKTKASTTLFAVYFSFWAICHSEGIICLLFTNQDLVLRKYNMLKNEYLYTYFFGFHFEDWTWWIRFLAPFALTALYVLFFSRLILNPAYMHELKFKTNRKIAKAKEENRFQKTKLELDKTLVKREENKAKLEEAQKRQTEANPHIQWDQDYEELSRRQNIDEIISDLKNLIYERKNNTTDYNGNLAVNRQSLTMCEAYGLVTRNERSSHYIVVTDKGWYFIRKHG